MPVYSFTKKTLYALIAYRPNMSQLFQEMDWIGVNSLPIVIFVSSFVGTNLALQGFFAFKDIGGQNLVGMFVALAGFREMAPIVAGAMVAAKSGSDIAARIGTMRVNEQIDALEVMGINPFWMLVVPKLFAMVIVLPMLTLVSDFFCLLSAYLVSIYQLGVNKGTFLEHIQMFVGARDIFIGLSKGVLFAILIALISTYNGFYSIGGPKGVGRATNMSVVWSCISCIVLNYFVTSYFYD